MAERTDTAAQRHRLRAALSGMERARRERRLRRLRRICVLAGVACIAVAVALLLNTTVAYDGHGETINGQSNTNSIVLQLGLLVVGVALLAVGLP